MSEGDYGTGIFWLFELTLISFWLFEAAFDVCDICDVCDVCEVCKVCEDLDVWEDCDDWDDWEDCEIIDEAADPTKFRVDPDPFATSLDTINTIIR